MTAAAVAEVGSGSVGRQFVADHLSIHFHPFSVGFAAVVADTTRTNRPTYFFPLHPCKTLTILVVPHTTTVYAALTSASAFSSGCFASPL